MMDMIKEPNVSFIVQIAINKVYFSCSRLLFVLCATSKKLCGGYFLSPEKTITNGLLFVASLQLEIVLLTN